MPTPISLDNCLGLGRRIGHRFWMTAETYRWCFQCGRAVTLVGRRGHALALLICLLCGDYIPLRKLGEYGILCGTGGAFMNPYIHQLQAYIEQHPISCGCEDIHTISELLYECYTEENPIDTNEIRVDFQEIDNIISELSFQDNDRIFALVCHLCTQHERLAFLEGLRVGMQLCTELM